MQHHFIHEALDYKSLSESQDFRNWLESGTFEIIADRMYRVFAEWTPGQSIFEDLQFSVNGNSSGFVFKPKDFSYEDLKFFQLVLVHKLRDLSYIVNLAEKKTMPQHKNQNYPSLVYYLKPSVRLSFGKEKAVQLYGNIHMECLQDEGAGPKLRFICHSYNDSYYESALPFKNLIESLFKGSDN